MGQWRGPELERRNRKKYFETSIFWNKSGCEYSKNIGESYSDGFSEYD
jgi:hypothetical protein